MAIKTKTDTRTKQKGVGKLGCFMSKTQTATSASREGETAGNPPQGTSSRTAIKTFFLTEPRNTTLMFSSMTSVHREEKKHPCVTYLQLLLNF